MLVCRNCHAVNQPDPGGPPEQYTCGNCFQRTLYRQEDVNAQTAGGATVGAIVGALAGGPLGAIIGGFIGGLLGNNNARRRG
jgi:hypothetical protein